MRACGRVQPSRFIHSKALQPPQTKLITWSFHMYIPGNIQENEARMVCLSLCWIKSAVQTFCVTKTLRCVEHSKAQSGESSDSATAAHYSIYKIQQQNRWKMKNVTILRSKNVHSTMVIKVNISFLTKRSTLMHLKRIPNITKKILQNFTTKMHINNTSICKQERGKDFG